MMIAHYVHRLPADYDLGLIRSRASLRGERWSAVPDLYFKAFLVRETGRLGAAANAYSSLYLWRREDAFRKFLSDGGLDVVTRSFGRPSIRTYVALEARRGPGTAPRFLSTVESDIPVDADLTTALAGEAAWCREAASAPGTVAATVGVDPRSWRTVRISIADREIAERSATRYEICRLASPLLDTLPSAEKSDSPPGTCGVLSPVGTASFSGIDADILLGGDTAPFTVMDMTVAPGAGAPVHVSFHEEKLFRVTEGALLFLVGEDRMTVASGAHVHVAPGIAHGFSALGDSPARMTLVSTPPRHDRFFRAMGELAEPHDPQEVAAVCAAFGQAIVGPVITEPDPPRR